MPSVRAPQQMAPARPSRGCRFVQTPSQQGGGSRVGGRRLRHARHSSPTSSAPAKHRDRLLTVTPDPGATHARTPRCPLRSCLYMSTTARADPVLCASAYLLSPGLIHQRYIRTTPRDTKSRNMYLGRDTCGIQSEMHTSNVIPHKRSFKHSRHPSPFMHVRL
jgi:hypothetical protein